MLRMPRALTKSVRSGVAPNAASRMITRQAGRSSARRQGSASYFSVWHVTMALWSR